MRLGWFLAFGGMLIAGGCGGSVDTTGEGGAGAGGGGPGGGGEGGATSSMTTSTGVPPGFCADTCADTAFGEGGCVPPAQCEEYCLSHGGTWPEGVGEAFATCMAENPLCFESVEGCILSQLHPPGSPKTARLAGAGFVGNEGQVVHAWYDTGEGAAFASEAVIQGGAFAFEWVEPLFTFDVGGPLLLVFIDVNGDGECDAADDLTAAVVTEWNGDYVEPVYEAKLVAPLDDPDFVCDYAP